jgi:hypothetical protein
MHHGLDLVPIGVEREISNKKSLGFFVARL